ncbi:hypothetical protein KIPB_007267 [Kipferlia bialata]|uniref:Uncharacterized protein n=1 Tax=Kipferlia bialata TaxID=797122 RepID=A0A9K3CY96_9EUKA|nr:hypothetical protein KIPB_007267 [Kipferlia bialata]|eukprot:g7267.t1
MQFLDSLGSGSSGNGSYEPMGQGQYRVPTIPSLTEVGGPRREESVLMDEYDGSNVHRSYGLLPTDMVDTTMDTPMDGEVDPVYAGQNNPNWLLDAQGMGTAPAGCPTDPSLIPINPPTSSSMQAVSSIYGNPMQQYTPQGHQQAWQ